MKRGFGDNRDGSITVNGMPIVQGRTMNAAVEQVEVLKGPSSLLYGIMYRWCISCHHKKT